MDSKYGQLGDGSKEHKDTLAKVLGGGISCHTCWNQLEPIVAPCISEGSLKQHPSFLMSETMEPAGTHLEPTLEFDHPPV